MIKKNLLLLSVFLSLFLTASANANSWAIGSGALNQIKALQPFNYSFSSVSGITGSGLGNTIDHNGIAPSTSYYVTATYIGKAGSTQIIWYFPTFTVNYSYSTGIDIPQYYGGTYSLTGGCDVIYVDLNNVTQSASVSEGSTSVTKTLSAPYNSNFPIFSTFYNLPPINNGYGVGINLFTIYQNPYYYIMSGNSLINSPNPVNSATLYYDVLATNTQYDASNGTILGVSPSAFLSLYSSALSIAAPVSDSPGHNVAWYGPMMLTVEGQLISIGASVASIAQAHASLPNKPLLQPLNFTLGGGVPVGPGGGGGGGAPSPTGQINTPVSTITPGKTVPIIWSVNP